MSYQDKLWIKFKDLDIECFCAYNNRRCPKERREGCHLYLAKFIQIEDEERHDEQRKNIEEASKLLDVRIKQKQKKFETELKRNLERMKKFRI